MCSWRKAAGVSVVALMACQTPEGPTATDPPDDVAADGPHAVAVAPRDTSLLIGESTQFTAIVRNRRGDVLPGAAVTWSSSNASTVAVDQAGTAHALAEGSVLIVATADEVRDSIRVEVSRPQITIQPDSAVTHWTGMAKFEAHGSAAAAGVHWLSRDTTLALTYSNGLVSTRLPGRVTIEAVSKSDPRHRASALLIILDHTTAEISAHIEAFTLPGTREVIAADQLSGVVDAHIALRVPAGEYRVELAVAGSVIAATSHAGGQAWLPVQFDTRQLANGTHALQIRVYEGDRPVVLSRDIMIAVSNEAA
jgi:hypothetical protein